MSVYDSNRNIGELRIIDPLSGDNLVEPLITPSIIEEVILSKDKNYMVFTNKNKLIINKAEGF